MTRYEKLKTFNQFINDVWNKLIKEYFWNIKTEERFDEAIKIENELLYKYDKHRFIKSVLLAVQEEIERQYNEGE